MTQDQLDLIPDPVLHNSGRLLHWLHTRGLRMTLLELDTERRRRKAA